MRALLQDGPSEMQEERNLKSRHDWALLTEMLESSVPKTGRRGFLRYVGAAAVAAATGLTVGRYAWTPTSPETVTQTTTRTAILTQTITEMATETSAYPTSLRAAADANDLLLGAAAFPDGLKETPFASTLADQFNFLTPENAMKWGPIDRDGYGPADALVKFASDHQMKVKGHCLIWHEQLPSWMNSQMPANDFRRAMEKHILEVVGHYRGKVYAWDVVNEAVTSKGLRRTLFLDKLGEGYIAEAFRLAHEADPDALLILNECDCENVGGFEGGLSPKSDAIYNIAKKLVGEGVPIDAGPIDAVGLQMHINASDYPKPKDIAANVRRLAALGLEVCISEMDVRIKDLPGTLAERLEVQRRVYHDVIVACVDEKSFMGVTFWGFTDAYSWVDEFFGPDDPLLFDENYQPKPAYSGVMDALLGK